MFARRFCKNHLEIDCLNPHYSFKSPIPKLESRLSIPKKIRSLILRSLKAFEFLQLSSNLHKIFLFHLKKFMSSRKLIKANNLVLLKKKCLYRIQNIRRGRINGSTSFAIDNMYYVNFRN